MSIKDYGTRNYKAVCDALCKKGINNQNIEEEP